LGFGSKGFGRKGGSIWQHAAAAGRDNTHQLSATSAIPVQKKPGQILKDSDHQGGIGRDSRPSGSQVRPDRQRVSSASRGLHPRLPAQGSAVGEIPTYFQGKQEPSPPGWSKAGQSGNWQRNPPSRGSIPSRGGSTRSQGSRGGSDLWARPWVGGFV
jgi:hypothetical protein